MKEKIRQTILKVFNYLKKKKVVSFLLIIFCINIFIYNIWQLNNEIKYGKFYFFKKLPHSENLKNSKTFAIRHFSPYGIKIDSSCILFFIKSQNNEIYSLYSLDLKEKKFKKCNTEFNYSKIEFAKQINGKIYIIFSKLYDIENFKDDKKQYESSYLIVYNHKKDVIENKTEIKEILKNPQNIQTVSIKGENYIIYKCMENCHLLKKTNNPYLSFQGEFLCQNRKPNYYFKLFSTKTNKTKNLEINGIDKKEDVFLGQMENGISLFYKKQNNYKISSYNLENNKKLFEYNAHINAYKIEFILIGENKFLMIYRPYNAPEITIIDTFLVSSKSKIEKIASTKISDKKEGLFKHPFFPNQNYIVLTPERIIFCCGRQNLGTYIYNSKKTYLFNYKANEFKRITDFKYKSYMPKFIKLNDSSFLLYSAESETSLIDFVFSLNRIYKFDLKKGM